MGTALERGKFGDTLVEIIRNLQHTKGISLRGLSRESGVRLGRLGNVLSRGYVVTIDEIADIAAVLDTPVWVLVAAAEWAISGQRPALEGDDVDWLEIYQLAATVNPELRLPPEIEQVFDSKTTPKPQLAPHEPPKIEHLFDTKTTPLFSDRRNDGYHGNEALPRMA